VSFAWYFREGKYSTRREVPKRDVLSFLRPGVDLELRAHEVEKLLNASYGSKLEGWGLDREDVLQEVVKGILSRNNGPGAYDPDRGAFSTYVTMVCGCVISNMRKRLKRQDQHEQIGLHEVQGGAYVAVPVSHSRTIGYEDQTAELKEAFDDLRFWIDWTIDQPESLTDLAQDILPLVYQGMQRREIAQELGLPLSRVGRALRVIREAGDSWRTRIM
jgi:RNA polymerase sigma factor (sigma-70 family)